jgi:hypothetical protein
MIDGDLFDTLDYIARVVRNRMEFPFGGKIRFVFLFVTFHIDPVSKFSIVCCLLFAVCCLLCVLLIFKEFNSFVVVIFFNCLQFLPNRKMQKMYPVSRLTSLSEIEFSTNNKQQTTNN